MKTHTNDHDDQLQQTVLLVLEDNTKRSFIRTVFQNRVVVLVDATTKPKNSTVLVDALAELCPAIELLIGAPATVSIVPATTFFEATATAASVMISNVAVDQLLLDKIELVAAHHLQRLCMKKRERQLPDLFIPDVPVAVITQIYEAVERTLLNIGGRNLGHGYTLTGSAGQQIEKLSGKLATAERLAPEIKTKVVNYKGRYDGHSVTGRYITVDVTHSGLTRFTVDIEKRCSQIQSVAVPLLNYVTVQAKVRYSASHVIDIEALSICIDTDPSLTDSQLTIADSPPILAQ